ncbi:MAG: hypothetical protein EOM26_07970 [Alphaproteobacteria bacterium]|nr:hypothetical protein [Alphaproteobacteria bacterium]
MSAAIKNALSNLNDALDYLELAVDDSVKRSEEQQRDLFAAQAALNDNTSGSADIGGIDGSNAELFARRLDDAIGKVERLLKEG